MTPERRDLILPASLRPSIGQAEGDGNTLRGYAATFGTFTEPMRDPNVSKAPFIETIRRGAFSRTLKDSPDVRFLWNHNTDAILGRTKSGTLKVWEDDTGLGFELALPDTGVGRDVRELVRRGDVDGCSFGFFVVGDEMEQRSGQPHLRTLTDVALFEVSITPFPAYSATSVGLRAVERDPRLELDYLRRRLGLSDEF